MKKYLAFIIMAILLISSMSIVASAEEYEGKKGMSVEYDGSKLVTTGSLNDVLDQMLPGDTATVEIQLKNSADNDVDFWMSNDVLQSFEDSSEASGGAYEYQLAYKGKDIYNSAAVGGTDTEAGVGLHKATGALDEYFYLDTLSKGQTGSVTLKVTLDGETQRNAYMDTAANLEMKFAVEEIVPETVNPPKPQTGDTNNMTLYLIAICVSGIILLAIAVGLLRGKIKKVNR